MATLTELAVLLGRICVAQGYPPIPEVSVRYVPGSPKGWIAAVATKHTRPRETPEAALLELVTLFAKTLSAYTDEHSKRIAEAAKLVEEAIRVVTEGTRGVGVPDVPEPVGVHASEPAGVPGVSVYTP